MPIFYKLAFRGLARNRRRSLITFGAIAIGLAGLTFLWGYVGGINRQMIDNITGYLTGHIEIHTGDFHDNPELARAFASTDGGLSLTAQEPRIAAIAPRIEGEALASGPEKTRGVRVIGIDPQREQAVTTLWRAVRDGRFIDANDPSGVLLGSGVADVLGVHLGDEVTLVTQAADGSIGAARYRVRGIFNSGINLIDDAYIFLPLASAQSLYSLEGRITTLAVRLKDLDAVPAVAARLRQSMGARFEVLGWPQLLPALADDVLFHEYMIHIVLLVVFAVVTLGIANTVLMGVMERVREFGIMLALGTTAPQLARTVVYEALGLGVLATLGGSLLGMAVVAYFGRHGIDLARYSKAMQMMPGLTGVVYPALRLRDVLFLDAAVLGMTLLSSLYPAWKAASLAPVEAIQGTAAAPRRSLSRYLRLNVPLPARAVFLRVGLRNIARNPRRSLLTLGALGAGFAAQLFLGALSQGFYVQMRDNATDLLTGHLQLETPGLRKEFDPKLTLSEPDTLLRQVRADPRVAAAAPRLQAMTMISSPTRSEAVMLYGVDPEAEPQVTQLHRKLGEGRYLSPGAAREILVGRGLADRLKVRRGEKIVVMAQAADGSLGSEALRIAGLIETGNDILDRHVALTSLQSARELLGTGQGVSTIVIRLKDIGTVDTVAATLQTQLGNPSQQVATWKSLLPEVVQMLDLQDVNLRVVLLVVFAIVALGVVNTMLMAVLERTREFGLQLALGTHPAQIMRTVLYESLVLAGLGLAVGLLMAEVVVGYYHAHGFDLTAYAAAARSLPGMTGVMYPAIVPQAILRLAIALLATSLLAAVYPAWRAARLDAAQALRHV